MKRAIIIMTKIPLAGTVKTRLQSFLSAEECAELAAAFLMDTENKAKTVCNETIIAFSPPGKGMELENLLQYEHEFIEQTGADLGERMFNAFQFAFEKDLDAVVMIGTDSPTFPPEFIAKAFEFLEKTDAVLGKTTDGGFYLIGLHRLKREIFENVEWSSPNTFAQTKRNFMHLNFDLREIPAWYDVDEPADLRRLCSEFQINESARHIAPQTFRWINRHKTFPKSGE